MFDPKIINQTFGKAARHYDEHAQLQKVVREECIAMARDYWKPGLHILDLGSGTGAFSEETQQHGLHWKVSQLDLSQGMCEVAREHNRAVVNGAADAIPFADGTFDGVFSSLMMQWVYDPLPVMREITRVTKPESVCVMSTLAQGTLQELRESFAEIDSALHVNYFADPAPLTALCVHGGYKLLACEEETITIEYPDVKTLMRSLKAIGASATQEKRKGGLMTPRKLEKLEDIYRTRFASKKVKKNSQRNGLKNALPATWQVLYMVLERT